MVNTTHETQESVIDIEHVRKCFGAHVIYRDLSLSIKRGEILTIMGGSGSGKSVLLKLILGLLAPDRGRILIAGQDVHTLDRQAMRALRRHIGMVFQGSALFDSMTVYENIAYPLREHFNYSEAQIAKIVAAKLELVSLSGVEQIMPSELSGGMKKRIGLARAIATDPDIVLYDEPSAGLDPSNSRRIDRLICSMRDHLNVTSVLVTHDMTSAFSVSDRVAFLYDGCIPFVGTPEEARTSGSELLQAFIQGTLTGKEGKL